MPKGSLNCPHRPACPAASQGRWKCGQRTGIEDAMNRGLMTREDGMRLLQKYGLPLTPIKPVKAWDPPKAIQTRLGGME